jgi:hypothetical protein
MNSLHDILSEMQFRRPPFTFSWARRSTFNHELRRRAVKPRLRVLGRPSVVQAPNPLFDRRPRLFRGCGKPPAKLLKVGETAFNPMYVSRRDQLAARRKIKAAS